MLVCVCQCRMRSFHFEAKIRYQVPSCVFGTLPSARVSSVCLRPQAMSLLIPGHDGLLYVSVTVPVVD